MEDTSFLYGEDSVARRGDGELKADDASDEEGVEPKGPHRPVRPSRKDIAEHELTHIPFRDWCVHCRRASARCGPHLRKDEEAKVEEKENAVATYHCDYTYMTDCGRRLRNDEVEEARKVYKAISKPVLVELDGRTEGVFAHRVDAKGVGDGWPLKKVIEDMGDCAYNGNTITTKCDQEPPIIDLHNEISKRRPGITITSKSAEGDRRGNGGIENAIQRFQNQSRRIFDNVQTKAQYSVAVDHSLFDWLVEWAAGLITRYVKGKDGKSAFGRMRGYETQRTIAECW